jgi:hypothetical protein
LEHPQGRKSAHGSDVLDLVVVVDNSKPRIVVEERCRNLSAKLCSTLQHRVEMVAKRKFESGSLDSVDRRTP